MPEDNQKDTAQKQADLEKENPGAPEQPIHVRNPFTGKEVDVTPEQIEGIEKQIEANTERD
jgi:hypothetical protein